MKNNKHTRFLIVAVILTAFTLGNARVFAQTTAPASDPPYLNPALPIAQRVDDLVSRMTLEEKASQLVNQARAIPRLNIPAYDWWSESLHGVLLNGTTEFPEPIALAATFDTPRIHEMAVAISTEGRIKHAQACAPATATSSKVSISGRRTSTSFAIPDGAAVKKLMGRIPSLQPVWAWHL